MTTRSPALLRALLAAAVLLPATAVVAGAAAPAAIVKQRHQNFEAMGKAMKGIGDQFKLPSANLGVIRANAAALAGAAAKVGGYFPKGTGPDAVKTDALPAIWQRPADFSAATQKLVDASKGLQAAAEGNDIGRIQAAMMATGGACKGCHDQFRKPRGAATK